MFHFIDNEKNLQKIFEMRFFASDSVNITFSNTEEKNDQTLVFLINNFETIVFENGDEISRIDSKLKSGEMNLLNILYTASKINLNNEGMITGKFSKLRFISFSSTNQTSWVVDSSKFKLQNLN